MLNLKLPENNKNVAWLVIGCLAVLFLAAMLLAPSHPSLLWVIAVLGFFVLLWKKPQYGLYLMAFFLPVIGWNFNFVALKNLEIPFIDLLSLAVFTAFLLKTLYLLFFDRKKFRLKFSLLIPFLFFFASVTVSNLLSDQVLLNIWYSVRNVLFFYLIYLVMPVNIIKNEKILKNTLLCFAASGLATAVMGVVSIFGQDWHYQFVRFMDVPIFGVYPLGNNHNLLAEVLIVTIFFTQALKYWYRSARAGRVINLLSIFQVLVLLGTFSRAAWIALAAQVILFLAYTDKATRRRWLVVLFFCVILLSPLALYMYRLQSEFSIGGSSTENRLIMTEIAWDKFIERPIFGYGSGQFVNLIGDDIRFIAKYGAPLDSHGVWQKILAENGLFGVFTFALFFGSILVVFHRTLQRKWAERELLLPIFLGGVGMFVIQFFNTSYYKGKLWLPIALGLAAISLAREKARAKNKSQLDKLLS